MTTKKGYGEILKKAREERKLTHSDIHKVLRMDPGYAKALEEENLEAFEKPIYMRLFLKTYAKYLKLDYDPLLKMLDETQEVIDSEQKQAKQPHHFIQQHIGADLVQNPGTGELEKAPGMNIMVFSKQNMIIIGAVAAAVVLLVIILAVALGKKGGTAGVPNNNVYVAPVAAPASLKVSVRAKEDVWMKARFDGTEEDFLLKRGEEKKWKDTNRIVFLVGNAGGVEFTVNNDTIGAIGEPGEVINGLVFETGKNWYIDRAQGFKRENPKPAVPTVAPTTPPAAAPAAPAAADEPAGAVQ